MTTIFPWLNCLSSHVIKIKDVLGGNYDKLDKLYNVNWEIDGLEHRNTLDDADVCIYENVQGMLSSFDMASRAVQPGVLHLYLKSFQKNHK